MWWMCEGGMLVVQANKKITRSIGKDLRKQSWKCQLARKTKKKDVDKNSLQNASKTYVTPKGIWKHAVLFTYMGRYKCKKLFPLFVYPHFRSSKHAHAWWSTLVQWRKKGCGSNAPPHTQMKASSIATVVSMSGVASSLQKSQSPKLASLPQHARRQHQKPLN